MPYKNKELQNETSRLYYLLNKEKSLRKAKERIDRIKNDPEQLAEWTAKRKATADAYYNLNKEVISEKRKANRKRIGLAKYGLSIKDYDKIYKKQKGVCAICKEECNAKVPSSYDLVVDHCHSTGTVRGLLCHACNKMLGMAKDNISTLKEAIKYLKKE